MVCKRRLVTCKAEGSSGNTWASQFGKEKRKVQYAQKRLFPEALFFILESHFVPRKHRCLLVFNNDN